MILLAAVAGLSKRRKELLTVRRKDLPLLTWIGLVSFCLFPLAYGTSLKRLTATMGAILFATTPLWSAGLSYFIRKEKVKLLQMGGILLTLVGVGVLATAKQAGDDFRTIVFGGKAKLSGTWVPDEYVADYVAAHPQHLIGFLSVDPTQPGWEDEMREGHEQLGLRGIKLLSMQS